MQCVLIQEVQLNANVFLVIQEMDKHALILMNTVQMLMIAWQMLFVEILKVPSIAPVSLDLEVKEKTVLT